MENKLTRTRLDALLEALRSRFNDEIEIVVKYDIFEEQPELRFFVNWSALGSQDTDKTFEFSFELNKAAEVAQKLNNHKWHYISGEDKIIDTKEKYYNLVEDYKNIYLY